MKILKENQAAEILAVSVQTLRNWRHLGRGPVYIKVGGGRAVRYLEEDCTQFIMGSRIEPHNSARAEG